MIAQEEQIKSLPHNKSAWEGFPSSPVRDIMDECGGDGYISHEGEYPIPISRLIENEEIISWCLDQILAVTQEFKRVSFLSIGAGTGVLEERLQEHGSVLAVDLSPNAVTMIRSKGVPAICADIRTPNIDLEKGSYDCVILANSLGSIGLDALPSISEYLKTSGKLIVFTDPYDIESAEAFRRENIPYCMLTEDEIRLGFLSAGLQFQHKCVSEKVIPHMSLQVQGLEINPELSSEQLRDATDHLGVEVVSYIAIKPCLTGKE